MSARAIAQPNVVLSFDKDDDDTLDFVLATANLRAIAYGIANKTRFQVKGALQRRTYIASRANTSEMAGNIIPAIATTNAIIAGFVVMQALNLLSKKYSKATGVHLKSSTTLPLGRLQPSKPDPRCGVCRDTYISFKADPTKVTLGTFVNDVVKGWLAKAVNEEDEVEWAIYESSRILADPDFDDNYEKTLADLGIDRGKIITVRDEDEKYRPIQFCLTAL